MLSSFCYNLKNKASKSLKYCKVFYLSQHFTNFPLSTKSPVTQMVKSDIIVCFFNFSHMISSCITIIDENIMVTITSNYYVKQVISKAMLVTLVEGDSKAPLSIATTPRCRGGRYSIPWIVPLYP